MDEKPKFWDFYKASFRLKDGEHIYLNDRQCDLLFYLRILLFIVFAVLLILLIFTKYVRLWGNIHFDFSLAEYAGMFVIDLILIRIFYSFNKFEKIPENEYNEAEHSKAKPKSKRINLCVHLILILFVFLNSVSFAYLLYFAEGEGKAAQAQVSLPDENVSLNGSSPQTLVFSGSYANPDNETRLEIKTYKIPGAVQVYLNGNEIWREDTEYEGWFFWEGEYFNSRFYCWVKYNQLKETNTLEVKNNTFDKIWAFNVEQG